MDQLEKELEQVRQIRSLRVGSLKRKNTQAELAVTKAQQQVQQTEAEILQIQQDIVTLQREGISQLVNGNMVRVEKILNFNAERQKGFERVNQAHSELEKLIENRLQAQSDLTESIKAVTNAEKKLIGIEEVISEKLWKQ